MNKRHPHYIWKKFCAIKPWYFLILTIISAAVCVAALRANNEHMVTLRQAVYNADKNNGDTETALHNLQAYVTKHMNTNLSSGSTSVYPPIQLKYTYDRLVQAQSSQTSDANSQIYTDAQHYCEKQDSTDFSGHNRVPCIQAYVQSHTIVTQASSIPDALYKFSFISPSWSPDLAGWSLVATIVLAALFVLNLIAYLWHRHQLKQV